MIRERGITLEVCPTSNLNSRVVSGWDELRWILDTFRRNEVRFTINTDGPELLKTYIRDELAALGRLGILSVEEQLQTVEWARQASFVASERQRPAARRAGRPRRAPRSSARRPEPTLPYVGRLARTTASDSVRRRSSHRSASASSRVGLAVDAADRARRERPARDRQREALPEGAAVEQPVDEAGVERVSGAGRIDDLDLGRRQPQRLVAADRQARPAAPSLSATVSGPRRRIAPDRVALVATARGPPRAGRRDP